MGGTLFDEEEMISIRLYKYNDLNEDTVLPTYEVKVYTAGRKLPYERQYKSRRLADECVDWLESLYLELGFKVQVDA